MTCGFPFPLSTNIHSSKFIPNGDKQETDNFRRKPGERAVSEKGGRKENIFEQWHHSFGVEALSFYSHVLSYWHIPRPQSAPPPPPFCTRFLPSLLSRRAKWRDVSGEPRVGGGRGHGGVGEKRGFGKQSEGRGRNFPEIPLPPTHWALLTTSVYFFLQVYSISYFYFHCYDLELAAWRGIPGVLFFLFTGIQDFNGWTESPLEVLVRRGYFKYYLF